MFSKRNLYIALLLVLCSMLIVSTVAAAEKVEVAVNQSRVMNFYAIEKVAIASPNIADVVVVSANEVLLIGKAPGTTTLHVWSAGKRDSFQVEVAADDVPIANEIKNIIGLDDLKVSKIGKTIILEGKVNSQYQKLRAEKVAEAYGDKVVNLLEMTKPLQVKFEAVILEIDKEKTKEMGIKWGNDISAPGSFYFGQSATNTVSAGSVLGGLHTYSNINGQLTALIKNGSAKILSRPNVITLSGEKANIMVGGQIPIPISNQNGQISIEWKDYGIKLDIAPEVNAEGLINSKLKAEVSSLDWNSTHKIELGSNMNIPPIKMNKAETSIALLSGQTMAIGGLLSHQTSNDVTKVPFLADIPILGKLFTSTSYSRGETELIILVTPTIVDPTEYLPQATPEMKAFLKEDPVGGTKNERKNKNSDR
ncbi:MAG: type and secretion system protein [Firmicutes bacterium]|nr:type and secretion system protein [Bacillota bacterium]